jgi:hypothetical protein
VVKRTRKEERRANPAPGPIYATAGGGVASSSARGSKMRIAGIARLKPRATTRTVFLSEKGML